MSNDENEMNKMDEDQKRYYVTYAFGGMLGKSRLNKGFPHSGYGYCVIRRSLPLSSYEDVMSIIEDLKKAKPQLADYEIIILGWQELG